MKFTVYFNAVLFLVFVAVVDGICFYGFGCSSHEKVKKQSYETGTNICEEPPNGGFPNAMAVIHTRKRRIKVYFVFGKDYAFVMKAQKRCKVSIHINNDAGKANISEFDSPNPFKLRVIYPSGVKKYNLKWSTKYGTNSSRQDSQEFTLIQRDDYIGATGLTLKGDGIYDVTWKRKSSPFFYAVQWRPKACKKSVKLAQFGTVRKKSVNNEVDLSNVFYSKIKRILIFPFKNDKFLVTEEMNDEKLNILTRIGVPDNKIFNITCDSEINYCFTYVEQNCYKQNGPELYLRYEFSRHIGEASGLGSILKEHRIVNENIIEFKIEKPINLKYFTDYQFFASPANVNGTYNMEKMSNVTFKTPPTAPNSVLIYSLTSSDDKITIKWQHPGQNPPTGVLEFYKIGVRKSSNSGVLKRHSIECPITQSWCKKVFEVEDDKLRYITIIAKNINVTNETSSDAGSIRAIKGKLGTIQNFTFIERTDRSIRFKVQPHLKLIRMLKYYNISLKDSEGKVEHRNFSRKQNETESSITLDGLNYGEKYSIKGMSCGEGGNNCSDWSVPDVDFFTLPKRESFTSILKDSALTTETKIYYTLKHLVQQHDYWTRCIIAVKADARKPSLEEVKNCCSKNINCDEEEKSKNGKIFQMIEKQNAQEEFFIEVIAAAKYSFNCVLQLQRNHTQQDWYYNETEFTRVFQASVTPEIEIIIVSMLVSSAIVLLAIVYISRYMKNRTNTMLLTNEEMEADIDNTSVKICSVSSPAANPLSTFEETEDNVIYQNIDTEFRAISDLESRIMEGLQIEREFKSVPYIISGMSCSEGESSMNMRKNRYKNNLPYNETRVILPRLPNEDPSTDYINASFINIPYHVNKLIASQGPRDTGTNTVYDFYRMIFHYKPSHIIMIANVIENGKRKVAHYWPEDYYPVSYGNIEVTLLQEKTKLHYVTRILQLQNENSSMQVVQYQFTEWPDHGAPSSTYSFLQLVLTILKEYTMELPIVVHCSAGIGRTGTLLLVMLVMQQYFQNEKMSFRHALLYLRKGRPKLVENLNQFYFGHNLVLSILKHNTRTRNISWFVQERITFNNTEITEEFQEIDSQREDLRIHHYSYASSPQLQFYNRNNLILPEDSVITILRDENVSFEDQYINAIRIAHDDLEDYYIVTEHPMQRTTAKFWQLVVDYDVPNVVLLNYHDGTNQNFPIILPEPGSECTLSDQLSLEVVSVTNHEKRCLVWEYQVLIKTMNQEQHSCQVFQLLDWESNSDIPNSNNGVLFIANKLKCEKRCPNLISCSDGFTASCWMTTLLTCLSWLEKFEKVNVNNVTLNTVSARTHAITSLAQYRFLYETIRAYLLTYQESLDVGIL